jgi:hypothetical protein
LSDLYVIPEEMVIHCAQQFEEGEENNFTQFLVAADEFRQAGLTPVFLCSKSMKDMYVTTEEKMRKKYH